jgi:hypothetical protein
MRLIILIKKRVKMCFP